MMMKRPAFPASRPGDGLFLDDDRARLTLPPDQRERITRDLATLLAQWTAAAAVIWLLAHLGCFSWGG